MRIKFISMVLIALLSCASYVFAEEGHGHHEHSEEMLTEDEGSMMGEMKEETSSAVGLGNKVCPVSGGKVGTMGPAVQHEYKGKIYSLCCAGCVATFKDDPEKYAKIVEEQMGQHKEMGSEVKEINLEAYKFGYSPERIVVKKGEVVKLLATSRDVAHGVSIKEYGINEKVEKGKVNNIEFVADKTGEFDILCSVYCGAGHHSMKAKFIVE